MAGSRARLLSGLSGTKHHRLRRAPTRFSRSQGVARDMDDSYVCQGLFRFRFSAVRPGNLLQCWVRTRRKKVHSGEGEVGLRARFRCCRRPFPASPLAHPACPFQGTGAPRIFPAGQPPLAAAAGFGVQGVGMLLPR